MKYVKNHGLGFLNFDDRWLKLYFSLDFFAAEHLPVRKGDRKYIRVE